MSPADMSDRELIAMTREVDEGINCAPDWQVEPMCDYLDALLREVDARHLKIGWRA